MRVIRVDVIANIMVPLFSVLSGLAQQPCFDAIDAIIGCYDVFTDLAHYPKQTTKAEGLQALDYFNDLDDIIEDALHEPDALCL